MSLILSCVWYENQDSEWDEDSRTVRSQIVQWWEDSPYTGQDHPSCKEIGIDSIFRDANDAILDVALRQILVLWHMVAVVCMKSALHLPNRPFNSLNMFLKDGHDVFYVYFMLSMEVALFQYLCEREPYCVSPFVIAC